MARSPRFYVSSQGDVLDAIALEHYGTGSSEVVQTILAVNRGLASLGPVLPAGVRITLPAIDTTSIEAEDLGTAQLWG